MEGFAKGFQILIVFVADVLPLVVTVLVGRWKRFPTGLRFPLILAGYFGAQKLVRMMHLAAEVKRTGNWIFVGVAAVFLFVVLKYDLFSDSNEENKTNPME